MEHEEYQHQDILIFEETTKSPYIKLDRRKGEIELRGSSIPENTREFYYKFNRWMAEYTANPAPKTRVTFALMYMNSSSAVVITRMLRMLDDMIGMKTEVEIDWYFEVDDLEMKEIGEYYDEIMKCQINLHEVERL
jgi:hypothetical protein